MDRLQSLRGKGDDPASTASLVARAKKGDHDAWGRLVERYRADWLERYHGKLGTEVRRIYDTEDLVQSAVAEAFSGIGSLREESAFFVWVTAILRHKVALRYRENKRLRSLDDTLPTGEGPAAPGDGTTESLELADSYLRTLDAILDLFPQRPTWMTAVVLRHLDGIETPEIARRLGVPERTAFHWVKSGMEVLRRRLTQRE